MLIKILSPVPLLKPVTLLRGRLEYHGSGHPQREAITTDNNGALINEVRGLFYLPNPFDFRAKKSILDLGIVTRKGHCP